MRREDLPLRWAEKLETYLRDNGIADRNHLLATDFRHHLKINLDDGSFVFFNYAFYLLDRELNEVGVFTEHCGYHVFPLLGAQLELFESKWTDIRTP
jgi:hypothetical protein